MIAPTRLTAALLATAALAGCGGDDDSEEAAGGDQTTAPQADDSAAVELDEFSLEPSALTVSRGATVTAENTGAVSHNLTIERGPDASTPSEELAETPTFAGGESDSLEVDLPPGRYALVCTVGNHRELGMVGTLKVE